MNEVIPPTEPLPPAVESAPAPVPTPEAPILARTEAPVQAVIAPQHEPALDEAAASQAPAEVVQDKQLVNSTAHVLTNADLDGMIVATKKDNPDNLGDLADLMIERRAHKE